MTKSFHVIVDDDLPILAIVRIPLLAQREN
jgi:hypothetical protein